MTMPQHIFSKISLLGLAALTFGSAYAKETCSYDFEVLERTSSSFEFVKKSLDNLNCNENKFEGSEFKIVQSSSDEAIAFDSDPEIVKRAANVYFHLTRAKKFWNENIKSQYVQELGQLTIRIDITNAYSRTRHFKHADQLENYNNAWSTPEGETPRFVKDRKYWGKEIWFSPKKVIKSREEVTTEGKNPVYQSLQAVKDPIWEYNKNGLIYQGLSYVADPDIGGNSDAVSSAIQRLGVLAVIYTASEVTKHMDKFFINEFYYVDTAMVPEIIYHEFAHVALSDTMKTVHSVPVIEGMADYFAARIHDGDTLYEKMEGISLNRTKDPKNKKFYHSYYEESWNAESDFVLSLLWKARSNFDTENKKRVDKGQTELVNYDQLIYQAHFNLTEESDIMNDLTSALLDACHIECSSKRYGMHTLYRSFEEKGLN